MVNLISDSVLSVKYTSIKTTEKDPVFSSNGNTISTVNIEQEHLSAEKAKKMTDSMNKFLESTNTELRFKYHDELEKYYVTLINSKTEEVVREIPSKKLMDMYAAMCEFVGILVDKKI